MSQIQRLAAQQAPQTETPRCDSQTMPDSRSNSTSTTNGEQLHSARDVGLDLEPPAYDTLSLRPPSISAEDASGKKTLKQRWMEVKADDQRRRASRYQVVSKEEADRITGLDQRIRRERDQTEQRLKDVKAFVWAI